MDSDKSTVKERRSARLQSKKNTESIQKLNHKFVDKNRKIQPIDSSVILLFSGYKKQLQATNDSSIGSTEPSENQVSSDVDMNDNNTDITDLQEQPFENDNNMNDCVHQNNQDPKTHEKQFNFNDYLTSSVNNAANLQNINKEDDDYYGLMEAASTSFYPGMFDNVDCLLNPDLYDYENNASSDDDSSSNTDPIQTVNEIESASLFENLHSTLTENQEHYVSEISPLKTKINDEEEQSIKTNLDNSVFFQFIKQTILSNKTKLHEISIFEKVSRIFSKNHFTTTQISSSFETTKLLIELLPGADKLLEELNKYPILQNNNGKKMQSINRHSKNNISTSYLVVISKSQRMIFDVIRAVDLKTLNINKKHAEFLNKLPSNNTPVSKISDQELLDVSSNKILLPDGISSTDTKSTTLHPDIYLMPYCSLILYIQEIFSINNCVNELCHATKIDLNNILEEYDAAVGDDAKFSVLFKYKIGYHDICKMRKIRKRDFDYYISLSIHSDGAGTNSTFNQYSSVSTYIIQVELLNMNKTKDNLYTHIVYSSFVQYQETAYHLLMKEIQQLCNGVNIIVNIGGELKVKSIITYYDDIKGDYKELTDLLGICSCTSKMPYILDYTINKSSAELYYMMMTANSDSPYNKQIKTFSQSQNQTGNLLFNFYDLNGKLIYSVDNKGLVPHKFEKCNLFRTVEAMRNSFQPEVIRSKRIKVFETKSILFKFIGDEIFHVLSVDVFHSLFNQCKRAGAILFNSNGIQDMLKEVIKAYTKDNIDHNVFLHEGSGRFKFQLKEKVLEELKNRLTQIKSPFFGSKIKRNIFDYDTIKRMTICDLLHLFAIIIPLSFEALTIDDCYLLHCILLLSTIIKLFFDSDIDINDSKYNYKKRVDDYLFELFSILPPNLYIESMHILSYSPELFKLHFKISISCAKNERYIKVYKSNIQQSKNKCITAILNHSSNEIITINMSLENNKNSNNTLSPSFTNACKANIIINLYINKELTSINKCYTSEYLRNLYKQKKFSVYNNFRFGQVSFIGCDSPSQFEYNCMIRIKAPIDIHPNQVYINNRNTHGTLFGRLLHVLRIEQNTYFVFDKIYVTILKQDTCIYSDLSPINYYTYAPINVPYIVKMDDIDILPIAYVTDKYVYQKNITGEYKRLSLTESMKNTSDSNYKFDITSFIIDSISHFDFDKS